jgi:hypothetical protein
VTVTAGVDVVVERQAPMIKRAARAGATERRCI